MEKVVTLFDRAREPEVPASTVKVAHLEITVGGMTCLHCPPAVEEGRSRLEPGPSAQRPPFGQEGAEVRRPSRRSGTVNSKLHIKSDGLSSTIRLLEATAIHSQRNREVGVRP
jgi:hypothetical protein